MRHRLLTVLLALSAGLLAPGSGRAQDRTTLGALALQTENGDVFYLNSVSFNTESEVVEHQIVDPQGQQVILKIPGRLKWGDVDITRAASSDLGWAEWRKQIENGDLAGARQSFSIQAYTPALELIAQWDFQAGWPVLLRTDTAGTSLALIESMRLAHEGLLAITAPAPNQAPVINLPASYNTPVGSLTTFTVTASDPDSDPVTLANILAPAGATFSGGVFSWSVPLQAIDAPHTVAFRANDQQGAANSITTRQLTITVPRDYDADLMDDDWEIIWLGSLAAQAGDDADRDTTTNLDEFRAGTNPTNAASFFNISQVVQSNETLWIYYTAEPDITYQLECSTNGVSAGAPWTAVGSPWTESASGSSPRNFTTAASATSNAFYRIRAQR